MSLNRYENLRRYLYISPLKSTELLAVPQKPLEPYLESQKPPKPLYKAQEPTDASELPQPCLDDPKDLEHWWWRLEPMLSTFRTACQCYLTPGTEVAINEIMVRFHGRSADTCKMPNKLIKQGYKIFALAENGYIWYFQLSSRQHGIAKLEKVNELTPTGSIVLQMARRLPKFPNSHFVIYIDNYFTSIPLFSILRRRILVLLEPQGLQVLTS
jgi:Transposase IS4